MTPTIFPHAQRWPPALAFAPHSPQKIAIRRLPTAPRAGGRRLPARGPYGAAPSPAHGSASAARARNLESARAAQRRGDGNAALEAANQALAIEPKRWIVRQEIANARALLGNHRLAAAALREAVRINTDNRDVTTDLVVSLSLAEELDAVEREATTALARWPDHRLLFAARAESRALRGKRLSNDVTLVEAMRLEATADAAGALAAYRRAVAASPGYGFPGHLARRSVEALSAR